jgi:hypothetical protein
MNDRIEQCLYLSGLTAQGCWDELDDYAKQGIHKFAEMIIRECIELCAKEHAHSIHTLAGPWNSAINRCKENIATQFGVEE